MVPDAAKWAGLAALAGALATAVLALRARRRALVEAEQCAQAAKQGLRVQFLRQSGEPMENGHIKVQSERLPEAAMRVRSLALLELLNQRRSLRFFSTNPVPEDVVNNCILAAGTAPSGAHCQPWQFCIVKTPQLKETIRELVEKEEQVNYDRRMRRSWVKDVESLVTGLHDQNKVQKPYLTEAPLLCVVMKQSHGVDKEGNRLEHYYVEQSVGLAVGLFLAALTNVGLCTLTSTPMGAEKGIREALGRPEHEKVFLLLPIGYPSEGATVPYRDDTTLRKPLSSIASFH